MSGKASIRARRTARAIPNGQRIFEFMQSTKLKSLIVSAVEAGYPPVSAISHALIEEFGSENVVLPSVKMFVGLCVSANLENDYEVMSSRVRLSNDPVFKTGTVYTKKSNSAQIDSRDMLRRILEALDESEVDRALEILNARRALRSAGK